MNSKAETINILVVDDEPDIIELLSDILSDEGYQVKTAANATDADELYKSNNFHLVLLDIWMPDVDGITLLSQWTEKPLKSTVIMMSGHGTIETAVKATKLGAYDFIEKPLSMAKLLITIENAIQKHLLLVKNSELMERLNPPVKVVGRTRYIKALCATLEELKDNQLPVLFAGPAGSGKTHFCRYLHQQSEERKNAPFISVNATSLPEDVTREVVGALDRKGFIQQSQGGTLFINEVSELSHQEQQLILDIIKSGNYYNPYKDVQESADIRFCFATKLGLDELKNAGLDASFFYEISSIFVQLEPLKSYQDDIPDLVKHFIYRCVEDEGLEYREFSMQALNYLRQYDWPGNVRELKNFVQRALVLGGDGQIELTDVEQLITLGQGDEAFETNIPLDLSLREARELFEKNYFLKQLEFCQGNIAKLSERTAMERTNLYRKLKSLGIQYK